LKSKPFNSLSAYVWLPKQYALTYGCSGLVERFPHSFTASPLLIVPKAAAPHAQSHSYFAAATPPESHCPLLVSENL